MAVISTRGLEKHLMAHGLLPAHCKLIEVSITPNSALILRYEVFIEGEQLARFAEAMTEAAAEVLAVNK